MIYCRYVLYAPQRLSGEKEARLTMILKKHGKRDTSSAYVLDVLQTYHEYRELCFDLVVAKRRRFFKPAIIFTLLLAVAAFVTQLPLFFSLATFMIFITIFVYTYSLFAESTNMPVEQSESGASLRQIAYPVTDENILEATSQIESIYGAPRDVSGSLVFREQPLQEPIMIDDRPVVGAFIEVELFDLHEPTDYRIMLENGQAVPVNRETYLHMTQQLFTAEDGTKQYVPVLTGKDESMLWGLVGDAQASTVKAKHAHKTKDKVPALREAIHDTEELLSYLELKNMSKEL